MKKILYKLTDENMHTYNGFQWEIGKWVETSGEGDLCGPGWIHAYESPLLAVLHNPMHAKFKRPRLFELEYDGEARRDGYIKCGVNKLRIVKEIQLPKVSNTQRVRYAILCAKEVYKDTRWNDWADSWLSGKDRSVKAAAAAWAAADAAWAAEDAAEAEDAAMAAAWAAAWAAEAWAADAARAEDAAKAVAAAARAVDSKTLDLLKIALEAMKGE